MILLRWVMKMNDEEWMSINATMEKSSNGTTKAAVPVASSQQAKATAVINPYAKRSTISNPYANRQKQQQQQQQQHVRPKRQKQGLSRLQKQAKKKALHILPSKNFGTWGVYVCIVFRYGPMHTHLIPSHPMHTHTHTCPSHPIPSHPCVYAWCVHVCVGWPTSKEPVSWWGGVACA